MPVSWLGYIETGLPEIVVYIEESWTWEEPWQWAGTAGTWESVIDGDRKTESVKVADKLAQMLSKVCVSSDVHSDVCYNSLIIAYSW